MAGNEIHDVRNAIEALRILEPDERMMQAHVCSHCKDVVEAPDRRDDDFAFRSKTLLDLPIVDHAACVKEVRAHDPDNIKTVRFVMIDKIEAQSAQRDQPIEALCINELTNLFGKLIVANAEEERHFCP